jgi:NosR/NirI family transcriptional regulator, nitrous oxide reductase regulator
MTRGRRILPETQPGGPGNAGRPANMRDRLTSIIRQCYLIWLAGLGLGLLPSAFGVERFPPPEFDSGYRMPATTTPVPRAPGMEYVDVLVLLVTLSLATHAVLKQRSRRAIFGLTLFSLAYFGFYRKGCICAIGSTQDVALALGNSNYFVPFTVVLFFLLPLLFTLFFGRTFCAAVCPLGAVQDAVLVRPVKVASWLEHALGLIPFFYLGAGVLFAATGSAFLFCQYDPFVAFFRRSGSAGMLALGAGFVLVGLFIGRPYCRFLCPYGALLSVLSRFSRWNVTLSPEDCLHCELCEIACPFGAIREPEPNAAAAPVQPGWGRLAVLGILTLSLAVGGGWVGSRLSNPLSRMHPTVRLAERIAAEEAGKIKLDTESSPTAMAPIRPDTVEDQIRTASQAFRQTGRPVTEVYAAARQLQGRFVWGGGLLGAFIGLVLGAKLIALSFREARTIYEPDRASCVACGRCYSHCPKELVRVKRIQRQKSIPLTPA